MDGKSLATPHFCYAPKTALKIKSKTHKDGDIIVTHCLNLLCFPANQSPLTRDMSKVPWFYLCSTHLCFVLSSEAGSHVAQVDYRTPYLAEDDVELLTFLSLRATITCRPANPPTFYVGIGDHAYIPCTLPTETSPQPHRRHFSE